MQTQVKTSHIEYCREDTSQQDDRITVVDHEINHYGHYMVQNTCALLQGLVRPPCTCFHLNIFAFASLSLPSASRSKPPINSYLCSSIHCKVPMFNSLTMVVPFRLSFSVHPLHFIHEIRKFWIEAFHGGLSLDIYSTTTSQILILRDTSLMNII